MSKERTMISLEVPEDLAKKLDTLLLQAQMKGVKKGVKIQKKTFVAYLLASAIKHFDHAEFAEYLDEQFSTRA